MPFGAEATIADLRISELAALAGANLAANDLLAVADISASESKKITVTDFLGNAVTLIADSTIPGGKILFGAGTIAGSAIATGGIGTTQLANDGVTADKLANESTVDLVTTLPASGAFTGQIALDTDDSKAYIWNGSQWVSFKAAGSVNTVIGSTAGVVNVTVTTSGDQVTIATTLDNTTGAAEFLAGPTGNAGAVGYRAIVGTDLPAATTSAKGGVIVDGEGLRMNSDNIEIDNDVVASAVHRVVTYDDKGLITAGRAIQAGDLPAATTGAKGGVIVGTGLAVDGTGLVNHSNNVISGTATKITYDSQGHVTGALSLGEADIPSLPASKITTGSLDPARIGADAITGTRIADYAVSKIGETQPTADHIGQFFFNPLSRDLFLWDGNVFQPIGISIGEIVFAGTFDASLGSGAGRVASVTAEGTAIGLVIGQALPAAAAANNRYYLVVSEAGTITSGNAPQVSLTPPDIILSNGSTWTEIDVSQTITAQVASNVSFAPAGDIAATNVQSAIEELDTEKFAKAGGAITGELLISNTGSFGFEGASANTFETYLTVVDPTADRTITFPDVTGTVVTTGDTGSITSTMIANSTIVDADISASAEIAVSKLADGAARQLLQTDATGTGVEWTDNVDIPGTLDVTGVATFDGDAILPNQADLRFGEATANGSNYVGFQAPAAIAVDVLWTLPGADGSVGQVLSTNGSGTLSWGSAGAGLDTAQTWTKGQRAEVTALTDAATVAVDFADSNNFSVTLGGNRTLGNPTNQVAGQSGSLFVTQDGTGSRTLAYSSDWEFAGGTAPTLSTAANAVDRIDYICRASGSIHAVLTKAFV